MSCGIVIYIKHKTSKIEYLRTFMRISDFFFFLTHEADTSVLGVYRGDIQEYLKEGVQG
jgi:hypothetical protein